MTVKAGDIVSASYFRHIPKDVARDKKYVLEKRDVDGDGQLDEVGYPVRIRGCCDAYERPFTLSSETPDQFSFSARFGQRHTVGEGTQVRAIEWLSRRGYSLHRVVHKSPDGKFPLRLVEYGADEGEPFGGHAFDNIESYAVQFGESFFQLEVADQAQVLGMLRRYIMEGDLSGLKEAVVFLNERTQSRYRRLDIGYTPFTQDQIDALVKAIEAKRAKLLRNATRVMGSSPRDLLAGGTETPFFRRVRERFEQSRETLRADVARLLGLSGARSSLDFDPGMTALIDSQFGTLYLCLDAPPNPRSDPREDCLPLHTVDSVFTPPKP